MDDTSATAPTTAEAAVQADLKRRDALDHQTNRLEASDGAVHIDTSELSLEEVVDAVVARVVEAGLLGEGSGPAAGSGPEQATGPTG
jgi:cytidylate kinase